MEANLGLIEANGGEWRRMKSLINVSSRTSSRADPNAYRHRCRAVIMYAGRRCRYRFQCSKRAKCSATCIRLRVGVWIRAVVMVRCSGGIAGHA